MKHPGIVSCAILAFLFLSLPAQAEEHEEPTGTEAEEHKEDPVTEAQSIDSFSSIEDGQPDEPGEPEFRIVPYGLATHGGENVGGLDFEAHTHLPAAFSGTISQSAQPSNLRLQEFAGRRGSVIFRQCSSAAWLPVHRSIR